MDGVLLGRWGPPRSGKTHGMKGAVYKSTPDRALYVAGLGEHATHLCLITQPVWRYRRAVLKTWAWVMSNKAMLDLNLSTPL